MSMNRYFRPEYVNYYNQLYKQAAQPPAGDPMAAGMPPGMPPDAAMMAGMPPGGDPMAAGMPPGMPPDAAMMGGMPPMPPGADPMAAAMPPAPAADPAADPAAASPKSAKQQKEELMNGIQASLDDIKDYTYNNLMILIKIANALNVQIPAETLVSPPDGKNMDIMSDPGAISAAASAPPDQGDAGAPMGTGSPAPDMAGMPSPSDMPPAEAAPSEVKMSMYRMMGVPQEKKRSETVKNAMAYLINKDRNTVLNTLNSLIDRK